MVEILQCNFVLTMAVKITKEKKSASKNANAIPAEKGSKSTTKKKVVDEDALAADKGEDPEEDLEEVEDDWGKTEEDSWDPDFEEFDVPKKASKKAGKGKKETEEEDDLGLDDDLNLDDDDLFEEKDDFDEDY